MRRTAAVLSVLSLLGICTQALAQVGAGAAGMQEATAIWMIIDENPRFYFAIGQHYVDPTGPVTYGAVGSGPCEVSKEKNFTMIFCSGKGRGKEVPFENVSIDPLLESAHLELTTKGYENVVDWTGLGTASWGGAVSGSGSYVGADAGFYRDARAQGNVLGVQLKTNPKWDWHFMVQGAGAAAIGPIEKLTVKPNGTVLLEAAYRISR